MTALSGFLSVCVLACLVLTGCGVVKEDDPLEAKLSAVRDSGETVRLADLTDFRWDEVHLFNEHTRREAIEKIVGSPVITAEYHASGSLLVFEEAGKVVRTVTVGGDYLRADEYTYGADVLAKPWGNGSVRLVLPGAPT